MKTFKCEITGVASLLHHRFSDNTMVNLENPVKANDSHKDHSAEWRDSLYYCRSTLRVYQPALQLERAMIAAATEFKIAGRRGKTYKEIFLGGVFISPDQIFHDGLVLSDFEQAYQNGGAGEKVAISAMAVRVQRARVVRYRAEILSGWRLKFKIEVLDESMQAQVVKSVLAKAGLIKGIGDYRPRYGRFIVSSFEEIK